MLSNYKYSHKLLLGESMKVIQNGNQIIVYQNKYALETVDFDNNELEEQLRTLFLKLRQDYEIQIKGYYNIDVYTDDAYGSIIELNKEEIEYFDYFDNEIDMRIILHDPKSFLYCLSDPFSIPSKLRNKLNIYWKENKAYAEIKKPMYNLEIGQLLEFSDLEYANNEIILKHAKQVY